MTNEVLLAIPLFIFMGVMLERSRIAEDLLETMGRLFGSLRGGLGISVVLVGMLLAAAKGVVGATVVTMGLITLPAMLRHGYDKRLRPARWRRPRRSRRSSRPRPCWCCSATSSTTPTRRRSSPRAIFAPESVSVSDLFAGAIVPGFALVALYHPLSRRSRDRAARRPSPPIPPDPARRRAGAGRAGWSRCWSRRCC